MTIIDTNSDALIGQNNDPHLLFEKRLTTGQAARELQIAPGTLANWRTLGVGPKYLKLRRNVFYLLSDLMAFMDESCETYRSTTEWKENQKGK